jgi:hypothetical protein
MGLCWLNEVIISLPYLEEDEVELLDDDILRGNYTMTGFEPLCEGFVVEEIRRRAN